VVIGGRLDIWGGSNAKLGHGDFLVAESDESDGSFMILSPTIAVVTNIDFEHIDHYLDMDALRDAFVDFINKIPFYGLSILCLDNEEIQAIIPRLKKRYITYGTNSQADLRAKDIERNRLEVDFEVLHHNQSLGRVTVGMPGNHNVLNALAAIAVGRELDVEMADIKKGLHTLGGLERRFQVKGTENDIIVLDDYGHHPTEICATLAAARECWPERRLVVIFQPHRYSRTKALYDRFVMSFNDADVLILAPIYAASEAPLEGVDTGWLYRGIKEHGHKEVIHCVNRQDLLQVALAHLAPGDVAMTLGAGDIHDVGEALLKRLKVKGGR
jgi:UDP-N-acetylmuramate--alanine ligase